MTLHYARSAHVPHGRATEVAGAPATAAAHTAHAVLAARGEWATNEKRLLQRAGLRGTDAIMARLRPEPASLGRAVTVAEAQFDAVAGR
jgi:hypothetical protein